MKREKNVSDSRDSIIPDKDQFHLLHDLLVSGAFCPFFIIKHREIVLEL